MTSVLWWFKQESWKMPEQNLLEVVPYRLWSTLPAFVLAGGDRPLRVGAHLYHVRLQCGGEKNIWKQERSHELCFLGCIHWNTQQKPHHVCFIQVSFILVIQFFVHKLRRQRETYKMISFCDMITKNFTFFGSGIHWLSERQHVI